MSVMAQLVELLTDDNCPIIYMQGEVGGLAEYLIKRGVTIQRWIPVEERLPALIPCDAGTAYSEAVNVLTSGRKVMVAVWDGVDWLCAMDYWDAWGEVITHWTPVLLPLPEPPKGE